MNWLVDTNVISEIMRREPDPRVLAWVAGQEKLVVSVVTLDELIYGLRRRSMLHKEAWLRQVLADKGQVLPLTDSGAHWSGEQRARLEQSGIMVSQADAMIAACAWEHGLILATRNTKDFAGFAIPLFNPFA
jgi:predicted nucleic acid-binding protein